jgi:hypothetical protein
MKPKFDMNRVCFAWNFSNKGEQFACVFYDIAKGKIINLLETQNKDSLFRVEDIELAFNQLIKKYPTQEKLLQYWQDHFSGWKG